ncbi:AAA family ATPase [Streptomyces atratus]|uniref:AAA family ATPase n=1 Tax=Streptomyces atratus TaxID=1893 RepID=UPI00324E399B
MYVARLRLDGVRGFRGIRRVDLDFQRPDGGYAGWTVLAGRNGSGKTTLLRAIALGLAGYRRASQLDGRIEDHLSHGLKRGSLTVELRADPQADTGAAPGGETLKAELLWQPEREPVTDDDVPPTDHRFRGGGRIDTLLWSSAPPRGWFHAGYGPFRRITGTGLYERDAQQPDRTDALRTLFDERTALTEAFDWLRSVHTRRLEKRPGAQELMADVLALLNDGLLPDRVSIEDVDSEGMWLRGSDESGAIGPRIELRRMSDGQRTVVALVLDIVRQMHAAYGSLDVQDRNGRPWLPHPGVVLIDEVDAHLHMTWQQRIGEWLTRHFPAIQFIVSTHSPYICQAADPGGLIRLPGVGEQEPPRHVDEDLYRRIVYGTGDDAALSELFGLDSPYSEEAREKRQELVDLEMLMVTGRADDAQRRRYAEIRDELSSSPVARVDEVMARIGRSWEGRP